MLHASPMAQKNRRARFAHSMPSESKGHDSRARGCAAGVSFAAKNDRVWGKTNFFFFAVSLPTVGGFLEPCGAWVRNEKAGPFKKRS